MDESPLLVKSLARCLSRRGCAVTAAVTFADTGRWEGPYDCGVFDVHVGAVDGIAVAARLMRSGTIRAAAFYTGTTDGRLLRRASELAPVVLKEAPLRELIRAVRRQIELAGPADARGRFPPMPR